MAAEIHVEILQPEILDDSVRIWGEVRGHPGRQRDGKIFFEVPATVWDFLAVRGRSDDIHDAFLRATIWSAMEAGGELTVHGRVSTRLLANIERFQEITCRWWPKYRPVRLRADEEIGDVAATAAVGRDPARQGSAVLAYSGGLDSTESLVAHTHGWRGRNTLKIEACVFVHGFDIRLKDEAFRGALRRVRAITDHYGVALIPMRSNLKELLPSWELTYPSGVLAAISLLERRFSFGLFASSRPYESLDFLVSETGSTAATDPLHSSATFSAVHDLAALRIEKTARLADEGVVWRNLRVCWEGEDLTTNCGWCEKCVRQMLCMRACGLTDFSAFRRPLTPSAVEAVRLPLAVVVLEWERCLAHAVARGVGDDEVFLAMRRVIERDRGVINAVTAHVGLLFRLRRRLRRYWPA